MNTASFDSCVTSSLMTFSKRRVFDLYRLPDLSKAWGVPMSWFSGPCSHILLVSQMPLIPPILPTTPPKDSQTPPNVWLWDMESAPISCWMESLWSPWWQFYQASVPEHSMGSLNKLGWWFCGWVSVIIPPLEALPGDRRWPIQARCISPIARGLCQGYSMEFPLH